MKTKIKVIRFPVLCDYEVHIEVTNDMSASVLKYKYTKNVDVKNTTACAVHVDGEALSFIFLPFNASPGTIAHESWHVIRRMVSYIGAELDNEMVAYHLGYITNEVWKLIK
jgi:hypothetical protein